MKKSKGDPTEGRAADQKCCGDDGRTERRERRDGDGEHKEMLENGQMSKRRRADDGRERRMSARQSARRARKSSAYTGAGRRTIPGRAGVDQVTREPAESEAGDEEGRENE